MEPVYSVWSVRETPAAGQPHPLALENKMEPLYYKAVDYLFLRPVLTGLHYTPHGFFWTGTGNDRGRERERERERESTKTSTNWRDLLLYCQVLSKIPFIAVRKSFFGGDSLEIQRTACAQEGVVMLGTNSRRTFAQFYSS